MAETIAALATATGKAGIAVVRVSGPDAASVGKSLTGRPRLVPRQATLSRIRHPETNEPIDRGLVLWFPAPASFTGEDILEIHCHGGPAVSVAVLKAALAVPGVRQAQPGEFTRRAFDNGKLDLTQVEALADLIAAETEVQRRLSLRVLEGALSHLYESWRRDLLRALALLEAAIDFPDEDLPVESLEGAKPLVGKCLAEIEAELARVPTAERLRGGIRVALIGPPNAGKSTLLNALSRRDVAIVSARAGTTRDPLEVHLDLAGLPVILIDTAGLRDTEDTIEQEGVRRARARAEDADVRLLVVDAESGLEEGAALLKPGDCLVWNKVDLSPPGAPQVLRGVPALPISAKTGTGLADLLAWLEGRCRKFADLSSEVAPQRERHRTELSEAARSLRAALALGTTSIDLCCEEVRLAVRSLGRLTGRVDVEDVLDVIFREFCIGK